MGNYTALCAALLTLFFIPASEQPQKTFTKVTSEVVYFSNFSSRAILVDGVKIWYATDRGTYGYRSAAGNFEEKTPDGQLFEYRSIAQTREDVFILTAGNPALLYKISKKTGKAKLVYKEEGENVFYDSMQFRDDRQGMAMGDPDNGCFAILTTSDGGETWKKTPCGTLPQTETGEAAFAASNSNLIVKGKETWLVSGGKKARIFYSPDNGKSWQTFATPIIEGTETTGIYSADFYDNKIGVIAGGDYKKPLQHENNKAMTTDGGKTWHLIGEGQDPAYVSCIQFVPGSHGKGLVTVGATGIHYSADAGQTWTKLLDDNTIYTLRFANDSVAYAGGSKKIAKLTFR